MEKRQKEQEEESLRSIIREKDLIDETIKSSAAVSPRMLKVFKYIDYDSLSSSFIPPGFAKPWTKKQRLANGLPAKAGGARFGSLPPSYFKAKKAAQQQERALMESQRQGEQHSYLSHYNSQFTQPSIINTASGSVAVGVGGGDIDHEGPGTRHRQMLIHVATEESQIDESIFSQ